MTDVIYVGDLCSVPLGSVHLGEREEEKEKKGWPDTIPYNFFYNHWRPQIIQISIQVLKERSFCVCRLAEVGVLEPPRDQGKAYETGQVRAAFSLNIHWVHSSHNLHNAQQSKSAQHLTLNTNNSEIKNPHNTQHSKPAQHSTLKPAQHSTVKTCTTLNSQAYTTLNSQACTTLNSQNLHNTQPSKPVQHSTVKPAQHSTVKICTTLTLTNQNLHNTQQSKPAQHSPVKTCTTLDSQAYTTLNSQNLHNTRQSKPAQHSTGKPVNARQSSLCMHTTLNSQNLHNTRQSKPAQHSTVTVKTCTTLNSMKTSHTGLVRTFLLL